MTISEIVICDLDRLSFVLLAAKDVDNQEEEDGEAIIGNDSLERDAADSMEVEAVLHLKAVSRLRRQRRRAREEGPLLVVEILQENDNWVST